MYEIRYTKGGEKDRVKLMRSPYADIAETILTQLRADPYSNTGGGLEKVDDGDRQEILIWEMWNHFDRMEEISEHGRPV